MSVFIEPLRGRDEPVGGAFISYSHDDAQTVKNTLVTTFNAHGLPYFLDEKDIRPSERFVEKLDRVLRRAGCGIVVLSPNSMNSPWLWFETGVMVGNDKDVFPFIVKVDDTESFLKELPAFIGQYHCTSDVQELAGAVEESIFQLRRLFSDDRVDQEVRDHLRKVHMTVTLDLSREVIHGAEFGYLLINFGRRNAALIDESTEYRSHRTRVLQAVSARTVSRDPQAGEVEVEYILPVHDKLGTQFKPFVDLADTGLVTRTIDELRDCGMEDVRQSDSGEKQRVYFLLPMEDRNVVTTEAGIPNNYLYPR